METIHGDLPLVEPVTILFPSTQRILQELLERPFFTCEVVVNRHVLKMNQKAVGAQWLLQMVAMYIATFSEPFYHHLNDDRKVQRTLWSFYSHSHSCRVRKIIRAIGEDCYLVLNHDESEESVLYGTIMPIFFVQYYQKYCRILARESLPSTDVIETYGGAGAGARQIQLSEVESKEDYAEPGPASSGSDVGASFLNPLIEATPCNPTKGTNREMLYFGTTPSEVGMHATSTCFGV
jgi:hypothetical protein